MSQKGVRDTLLCQKSEPPVYNGQSVSFVFPSKIMGLAAMYRNSRKVPPSAVRLFVPFDVYTIICDE